MAKQDDEPEWVEVASTGQNEEASLIAGLLESENIPVEIEGPAGGSPWPENLGAFGMSRVLVPPDRLAEARAVLEKREREFRDEPLEESASEDDAAE